MKIYDVSVPLYPGMPVYPGDPEFEREEIPAGDAKISRLGLSTHTGTHIDAPSHYLDGASGIDEIPLERLIGRVEVSEFPDFSGTVPAVFFKSAKAFPLDLAKRLCNAEIRVVGCDADSVGDTAVHTLLLKHNIAIIENLALDSVPCGEYSMIALPLNIRFADAAPARVVLLDSLIE